MKDLQPIISDTHFSLFKDREAVFTGQVHFLVQDTLSVHVKWKINPFRSVRFGPFENNGRNKRSMKDLQV